MVAAFHPAVRVLPPRSSSAASEVIDFARAIGFEFDEHQKEYAEAVYGWQDGTWAASQVCLIEPRQNGKTGAGQVFLLADCFLFNVECHTWTAHLFDTTRATFGWMVATIEGYRELSSLLKGRIRKSAGNFGWTTRKGAEARFRARSKSGGRGVSGNVLTWDEALILPQTSAAALIPTLSAKPHTQMRFLSSQGDDSPEADLLRGLRDVARKAADGEADPGRLAYVEAAAEQRECRSPRCMHVVGTRGCAMDDPALYVQANFAMTSGRMTLDAIQGERRLLAPAKFGMERLGWWIDPPPVSTDLKITAESWTATESPDEVLVDGVTTAAFVDMSWDRTKTAIAFAQRGDDGRVLAQLVAYADGSEWVGDFLRVEMDNLNLQQVIMQRMSPGQSLHDDLEAVNDLLSKRLTLWGAGDLASACGTVVDLLASDPPRVLHTNDGPVTIALTAQATREIGTSWVWDRKAPMETSKVDASPLIAMTGAIAAGLRLPVPRELRVH
jgi:hypothetical protein